MRKNHANCIFPDQQPNTHITVIFIQTHFLLSNVCSKSCMSAKNGLC